MGTSAQSTAWSPAWHVAKVSYILSEGPHRSAEPLQHTKQPFAGSGAPGEERDVPEGLVRVHHYEIVHAMAREAGFNQDKVIDAVRYAEAHQRVGWHWVCDLGDS